MDVRHDNKDLQRTEDQPGFTGGFDQAIVRTYRMRMQLIRAAKDERDFYAAKSLHFEKLKGKRSHQHSMRLNKQFRLILELEGTGRLKVVAIKGIEDYHK